MAKLIVIAFCLVSFSTTLLGGEFRPYLSTPYDGYAGVAWCSTLPEVKAKFKSIKQVKTTKIPISGTKDFVTQLVYADTSKGFACAFKWTREFVFDSVKVRGKLVYILKRVILTSTDFTPTNRGQMHMCRENISQEISSKYGDPDISPDNSAYMSLLYRWKPNYTSVSFRLISSGGGFTLPKVQAEVVFRVAAACTSEEPAF